MSKLAVIWRAAGLLFATGVDCLVEVLPPVACVAAPAVPEWVRGLFNHRGQLIPLVDVARLLGLTAPADRRLNRVLVVRCGGGPAAVEWPVGLWVDAVLELERLDFGEPGHHTGFATEPGRFLGPVVQTRWGQVQLVKPAEIFLPEQERVLSERLKEAAA